MLLASAHFEEGVENLMMVVHEAAIVREIKASKDIAGASTDLQLTSFSSDFFMNKSTYTSIVISKKGESDDNTILTSRRLYRMKNTQSEIWLSFEDNGTVVFNNSPSEFESFLCLVKTSDCNAFAGLSHGDSVYICAQKHRQFLEFGTEGMKLTGKPGKNCEFKVFDFRENDSTKLSTTSVFFIQHAITGKYLSADFNQLTG